MCAALASSSNFTVSFTSRSITQNEWADLARHCHDNGRGLQQIASITATQQEGVTCLVVNILSSTYRETQKREEIGAYGYGTGVFKNVTVIKNATAEKCVITNGLNVKIVVKLGETLVSLAPGDVVQTDLHHGLPDVTLTEPEEEGVRIGPHKDMPVEVGYGFPAGRFQEKQKLDLGCFKGEVEAERASAGEKVRLKVLIGGGQAVFKKTDDDETFRRYTQLASLFGDIEKNWRNSSPKSRPCKASFLDSKKFNLFWQYDETKKFLEGVLAGLKKIDQDLTPSEEKTNP